MFKTLKKNLFRILIMIIILIISGKSFCISESNNRKKVIMIILNRLTFEDLEYMDNLQALIEDGSIGVMNTRGLYGYKGAESYATINASGRANATYLNSKSYNLNNNISKIYKRRLGIIPDRYQIVNTEVVKLNKLNNKNRFNAKIGALGYALHKEGLKTAVFGNSDTADNIIRTNCLIAIDFRGFIDYGNVDNILIKDDLYPYGIRTDYEKILIELKNLKNNASLIVIETGDLDRLYFCRDNLTDIMYFLHRERILKKADEFIENLVNSIDRNSTRLIVISPNMGDDKIESASELTPLIFWGDGISKGILFSETTKKNGIVSNIDIAPSITKYLDVDYKGFTGADIKFKRHSNNLTFIKQLSYKIKFVSNIRKQFLKIYVISEMIFIITVTFVLLFKKLLTKRLLFFIKLILMLIIIIPLVFLIVSSYNIMDTWEYIKHIIIISFSILALTLVFNSENRLQFIGALTCVTILIDLFTNCELTKMSIIGYDPIIGARYYGLGNELVGILIFSLFTMLTFILKNKPKKLFLYMLLIFNIYLLISSNFGANLGGGLTLAFIFIYIIFDDFFKAKKNHFNINILKVLLILLSIVSIIIVIDIILSNSTTHISDFIGRMLSGDINYIYNVIVRKLLMNVKLFKVSIWGESLRTNIILFAILLITQKNIVKKILFKNKNITFGFKCSIISAIFGLLLNDSGVVMAALILLLNVTALTYLIISALEMCCNGIQKSWED
ncbi:hypothetical protein SAMN02745135_00358 [Caloranaerobacter azorensis DSM 13643]|uniref:Alkaline phosphatase n=1 Tax=Caloranaerobacter azorensis DSM 13643 TaxID=1121264 RepID=A0A1M5RW62_9FIRM|nr:hypothetical protein [Caloranaerobacter azorensis]SHH30033.1 hypothetical protein SAMN02745135_00358 [Caloranaerobacter azorensis DSM 13643]